MRRFIDHGISDFLIYGRSLQYCLQEGLPGLTKLWEIVTPETCFAHDEGSIPIFGRGTIRLSIQDVLARGEVVERSDS